jgi:hypothetical protein
MQLELENTPGISSYSTSGHGETAVRKWTDGKLSELTKITYVTTKMDKDNKTAKPDRGMWDLGRLRAGDRSTGSNRTGRGGGACASSVRLAASSKASRCGAGAISRATAIGLADTTAAPYRRASLWKTIMADVVPKQTNRSIVLDSPLGQMRSSPPISEAEELSVATLPLRLELLSKQTIQPKDILGKGITVELQTLEGTAEKKRRVFHGIVVRFAPGPMWRNGYRNFHAELVPWTWFLTRTTDCRIFENKKAPDIIEKIFQDLGFSEFEKHMTEQHPSREYCVQFRETDFNFVSRLMEEEGMFYFFKHEKGKHTMVLADNKSAYLDCERQGSRLHRPSHREEAHRPLGAGLQLQVRQMDAARLQLQDSRRTSWR